MLDNSNLVGFTIVVKQVICTQVNDGEKNANKHHHSHGYKKPFWIESPNVSFPALSEVV